MYNLATEGDEPVMIMNFTNKVEFMIAAFDGSGSMLVIALYYEDE